MVKEDIETVIDRLYDYINANKSTTVKDAALILSMPEEQVEKLAFLLEDSSLIEVRYSLTGAKLVSKAAATPKPALEKEAKESFESKAGVLEEQVESAESIAGFMEKDLIRRLKQAESNLKALESQKTISQEQVVQLESEMSWISDRLSAFEQAVKKVEAEGGSLFSEVEVFKSRLKTLEKKKVEKPVMERLIEFLVLYVIFLRNLLGLKAKQFEESLGYTESKGGKAPAPKPIPPKLEETPKTAVGFKLPEIRIPKVAIAFVNPQEEGKETAQAAGGKKAGFKKGKGAGKEKAREKAAPQEQLTATLKLPEFKMPKIKIPHVSVELVKGREPNARKVEGQKPIAGKRGRKIKPALVVRQAITSLKKIGYDRVLEKRKDRVEQHYWKKGGLLKLHPKRPFPPRKRGVVEARLKERMLKQQFPWIKLKKLKKLKKGRR